MSNIVTNSKDELPTDEDIETGIFYTLDMFKECNEILQMIDDIPNTSNEFTLTEKGFETFKTILDYYQEQPHLLDPHLQNMLNKLISLIMDPKSSHKAISLAFQYLWIIVKVRGYKTIIKKMPHEVKDLLPVLKLVENPEFEDDFYGSYILLMWLSIIIYMPFDLTSFDKSIEKVSGSSATVVERIFTLIKKHLQCAQSSREMAAYLASRFVTRPDLREKNLQVFIDYCFEVLHNIDLKEPQTLFHRMGILRALGLVFKHGKREELIGYASDVASKLFSSSLQSFTGTPLRKYSMKLVQRMGLTFLRPKLASWRYRIGSRSLASNMGSCPSSDTSKTSASGDNKGGDGGGGEEEEEEEIPDEIEEVIDYLLQGLKDQDTVVRWSAAKGIGRVAERLPQSLADDVLGEILQLFSTRESDKAWHGACLALAELARRGLLLPERLPDVMPILQKALVYDELRGQSSVGANIRDAACYLCWAFARAYHPEQMTDFVQQVATGLLIVSLFDREIPCRRAASAAFQEHVGRQGNFPHGIEILTTVDYFAVGIRHNAYLKLSVTVAQHSEYTRALIDHLVARKVNHWDSAVRELTAKALHNLTPLSPTYLGSVVLPDLLSAAVGTVLIARHGALYAAGHVIHSLYLKAVEEGKDLSFYVDAATIEKVFVIVPTLEERKLLKGMGGEYMRQAASVLIEKCSLAKIELEGREKQVEQWYSLLEDCILNFEEGLRSLALKGLHALWGHDCHRLDAPGKREWRDGVVAKYVRGLQCSREAQCLGYAAALGHLPKHLLSGKFSTIVDALVETTKISSETEKWALTRKEAINAILRLCRSVGMGDGDGDEGDSLCRPTIETVFSALLAALDDYTMDRRGDIGAWVREAAMIALQTLTPMILSKDTSVLSPEVASEMMTRICQQCVERIDRTRKVAGLAFRTILHCDPALPNIPDVDQLRQIFPSDWCQDCNWASESSTYNKFVKVLDFPVYRPRILLGLTYSLGGISANLSRYTLESLQTYLNERTEESALLVGFFEAALALFHSHQRNDRVILPLIKSLSDLLGSCAALDQVLEEREGLMPELLTCLKRESARCHDFHKLSAIVTTLCEMLRIETSCTKQVLTQLTIFLGYQYPKVRALTATSLLTALMDYGDKEIVPEDQLEEITAVLEDTAWMDSTENARVERNKICTLIGVPVPQPKKKA